jgi:hypothetical protein
MAGGFVECSHAIFPVLRLRFRGPSSDAHLHGGAVLCGVVVALLSGALQALLPAVACVPCHSDWKTGDDCIGMRNQSIVSGSAVGLGQFVWQSVCLASCSGIWQLSHAL